MKRTSVWKIVLLSAIAASVIFPLTSFAKGPGGERRPGGGMNPPGPAGGPGAGGPRWKDNPNVTDNPPGPIGGPGTNWKNPPGLAGGPGAGPGFKEMADTNKDGKVDNAERSQMVEKFKEQAEARREKFKEMADQNHDMQKAPSSYPPGIRGNPPGPAGGPGMGRPKPPRDQNSSSAGASFVAESGNPLSKPSASGQQ